MEHADSRILVSASNRLVRWTVVANNERRVRSAVQSLGEQSSRSTGLTVQDRVQLPQIAEPLREFTRNRIQRIDHIHDAENIVVVIDLGRDDRGRRSDDGVGFGRHLEGYREVAFSTRLSGSKGPPPV